MASTPSDAEFPANVPPELAWQQVIANAVDEMIWVWDVSSGQVVYCNPAFERFWGFSAVGHPGASMLLNHMQERYQTTIAALRQQLVTAEVTEYEEEFHANPPTSGRNAGTPLHGAWIKERANAVYNAHGQLKFVTHVSKDISWQLDTTARLRAEISRRTDAERNLDDANARLQVLIDTANDAVITIDEQSLIIDWNNAAQRIFGWTRHEAIGVALTTLIIPTAHRAQHDGGIAKFLRDGSGEIFNRRVETTALRRNGDVLDVELSVWPVRTGDRFTFSSFIRDISRRKAAERALAESEAKYRTVVENVSEGILVTAAGRILYANPHALMLTGVDHATALAKPFIEFIHPDDRSRVLDNHLRRLKGEAVENHYQFRVVKASGEVVWLEISAVVFEWEDAVATLNFLTDVTLRRQVEQDIRSALQRERELSELKSRFAAVASHEFRTPLAAILSSVELLDDYADRMPATERQEMLTLIKSAVGRMNAMVDQVLLASHIESGVFVFSPSTAHMPELLVSVASEMDRANAQAARIMMSCEGVDQKRMIDAKLVRHILVNLLSNALKYSPPESPIRCDVSAEGDSVVLAVIDHGIGIPARDMPRLFERFHRGTNVGNIQGTGIGLHVVQECAILHGGRIEVHSEAGAGTTFRVHLHAPLA